MNVIERLLKKKKKSKKKETGIYLYRTKIGILFDIDECLLLFLPRICRSSSNISDCSSKRERKLEKEKRVLDGEETLSKRYGRIEYF